MKRKRQISFLMLIAFFIAIVAGLGIASPEIADAAPAAPVVSAEEDVSLAPAQPVVVDENVSFHTYSGGKAGSACGLSMDSPTGGYRVDRYYMIADIIHPYTGMRYHGWNGKYFYYVTKITCYIM